MNARSLVARSLASTPSRVLSLLLAVPLSLVMLLHPLALLDADGRYSHGLLALAMWGISAGFVHGVGFDPRALVWRGLFSPVVAWPLMLMGYLLLT
ncbi:cyd operon YbgE family protein [Pseudomonas japonica]|uniref:cyd operon YbgE family protein n=1 Tax=Pseudomonas japonica TaxID=256466 RepID=UPI0015E3BDEA|nr:cyd operon YbgE family protein [Pseudomonas japonica]MBA1243250.1 Cyd operon protein YbgE [Pseudomonas japonica]MBA1287819.1 Cyd operon protein YbgE [Pseudomonas japonica]